VLELTAEQGVIILINPVWGVTRNPWNQGYSAGGHAGSAKGLVGERLGGLLEIGLRFGAGVVGDQVARATAAN
jgi:hypothetical protein